VLSAPVGFAEVLKLDQTVDDPRGPRKLNLGNHRAPWLSQGQP
jgi:hypothetical protein